MPAAFLRSVCLTFGFVCLLASEAHAQRRRATPAAPSPRRLPGDAEATRPTPMPSKSENDEAPPDTPRSAPQVGIAPGTPQTGT